MSKSLAENPFILHYGPSTRNKDRFGRELRHLLFVSSFSKQEIEKIIEVAIDLKQNKEKYSSAFKDKSILFLFAKPSLRTRVSFEVGTTQLGGHAVYYPLDGSPLGEKEGIRDTAQCLSRFVDIIAARVHSRKTIEGLAANADVPVINMLDDFGHPCQMLSDVLTIKEKLGRFDNSLKLSFFGDGKNNVTYCLMRLAALFGLTMDVACPKGEDYVPEEEVLREIEELSKISKANVRVVHSATEAAKDADIFYTDSWMSYGIPKQLEDVRKQVLLPFQVTTQLLNLAKPGAIFMNCLPAARGMEQTAEVIDGPRSVVYDQAENRLHVQKAIMLFVSHYF